MSDPVSGGHPDEVPLTAEERRAIRALERLAGSWPKSLWLYSASGTLHVMRNGSDGKPAMVDGYTDQRYSIHALRKIPNDGVDLA